MRTKPERDPSHFILTTTPNTIAAAPFGQHGVFTGNLNNELTKKEVAAMISRLISQVSSLSRRTRERLEPIHESEVHDP